MTHVYRRHLNLNHLPMRLGGCEGKRLDLPVDIEISAGRSGQKKLAENLTSTLIYGRLI